MERPPDRPPSQAKVHNPNEKTFLSLDDDEGDDIYELDQDAKNTINASRGATKYDHDDDDDGPPPPPRPGSIRRGVPADLTPPAPPRPGKQQDTLREPPRTLRKMESTISGFGDDDDDAPPPPLKSGNSAYGAGGGAPPPRPSKKSSTLDGFAGMATIPMLSESEFMYGVLDRKQCEPMLLGAGDEDGRFLVRTKGAGYVLSMCANGQCEHHMVASVDGVFTLNGNPTTVPCSTIPALIAHLSDNLDGITAMLKYPLAKGTGMSF